MIVALMGGLANQLFQYAFGISVAQERGEQLFFTRNRVDNDVKRSYGLDAFQTSLRFVSKESEIKFSDGGAFNPEVYKAVPGTTFIGYWQTEKYFNAPMIREDIQLAKCPSYKTLGLAEEITQTENSTFIHVRRGDYVREKHTSEFHGNLSQSYYDRAVERIRASAHANFFVFSDDPEWCRTAFPGFRVVDHNKPGDGKAAGAEHEDLWLMSLCRHAIIANSAFSWWGAWLGDQQKDRMVIAPKQWFKSQSTPDDLIPDRWIKI
jgi:Glycosyl transferase family 11